MQFAPTSSSQSPTSSQPASSGQPSSSSQPSTSDQSPARLAAPPGRAPLSKNPTKPAGLTIETASSMNLLNLAGWQPAEIGVSREPMHFDGSKDVTTRQNTPPRIKFADAARSNASEEPPPPPPPKLTLPNGWSIAVEPATGARYYYNSETNETSWERP